MVICQLTDLHIRPPGVVANRVSENNMLTEPACRAAQAFSPRPDVVIITGDLTGCGLAAKYTNLSAILVRSLSMPVYVIRGFASHTVYTGNYQAPFPFVTETDYPGAKS